jgi:microcystin-dependent protein
MADPYVGEIRIFAGTFAPAGWAFCDGQIMPVAGNEALFNLIGTIYGGDGDQTFALPDLRGRVPVHMGQGPGLSQNNQIGDKFGVELVTLTTQQIPTHRHALQASTAGGTTARASGAVLASAPAAAAFVSDPPDTLLAPNSAAGLGGSQPHDNMPPFVAVSYIISLFGVYPSPT